MFASYEPQLSSTLSDSALALDTFGDRLSVVKSRWRGNPSSTTITNSFHSDKRASGDNPSARHADLNVHFSALLEATNSGDGVKVEKVLLSLIKAGRVREIHVGVWESSLLLLATSLPSFARMQSLIDTYLEAGLQLTSRVVHALVAISRRLLLDDQPVDLAYVFRLYDELVVSRASISLQLKMALMQLMLDGDYPEKALDFGTSMVRRPGFVWTEAAYHLFIKANLALEPPAIETAFVFLREMKAKSSQLVPPLLSFL